MKMLHEPAQRHAGNVARVVTSVQNFVDAARSDVENVHGATARAPRPHTIPAEGWSAKLKLRPAPQRERSDTHRRSSKCARRHSEGTPTRTISAEGCIPPNLPQAEK